MPYGPTLNVKEATVNKRVLAIVAVVLLVGAWAESANRFKNRYEPGNRPMRAPSTIAPDVGSESCVPAPPLISGLPFNDTGNTCTFANDMANYSGFCSMGGLDYPGEDVVYQVTLGAGNSINLALAMDPTDDLGLMVIGTCGDGTSCEQASDVDVLGGTEEINGLALAAGTYYVYIDSYWTVGDPISCGNYALSVGGTLPVELVEFSVE